MPEPTDPADPEQRPQRTARLRMPRELWGRRVIAIGAVVLLAALIGGGVLLLTGDDSGSDSDEPDPAEQAQLQAEALQRLLPETTEVKEAGIEIPHPKDWKVQKRGALVNLESPDRCIALSISAPVEADLAGRLMRDSIKGLEASFGKTKVEPQTARQLDGLPTQGALVEVKTEGATVVVRQTVSKGTKFAYLTQTVFRAPPCADTAPVADQIVANTQFDK